jgi:hypothetical protein
MDGRRFDPSATKPFAAVHSNEAQPATHWEETHITASSVLVPRNGHGVAHRPRAGFFLYFWLIHLAQPYEEAYPEGQVPV